MSRKTDAQATVTASGMSRRIASCGRKSRSGSRTLYSRRESVGNELHRKGVAGHEAARQGRAEHDQRQGEMVPSLRILVPDLSPSPRSRKETRKALLASPSAGRRRPGEPEKRRPPFMEGYACEQIAIPDSSDTTAVHPTAEAATSCQDDGPRERRHSSKGFQRRRSFSRGHVDGADMVEDAANTIRKTAHEGEGEEGPVLVLVADR